MAKETPDNVIRARKAARRRTPASCIRAAEKQLEYAQGFVEAATRKTKDPDTEEDIADLRSRVTSIRLDSSQLARQIESAKLH